MLRKRARHLSAENLGSQLALAECCTTSLHGYDVGARVDVDAGSSYHGLRRSSAAAPSRIVVSD
jgi:hypothetical protein